MEKAEHFCTDTHCLIRRELISILTKVLPKPKDDIHFIAGDILCALGSWNDEREDKGTLNYLRSINEKVTRVANI
jgi:hypothetical protein